MKRGNRVNTNLNSVPVSRENIKRMKEDKYLKYKIDKMKSNARSYAKVYLKRGLIKKTPCVECGNEDSQMHHEDYTKPIEVIWLCRKCHMERHRESGVKKDYSQHIKYLEEKSMEKEEKKESLPVFAKNLKELRRKKEITQEALAKETGIALHNIGSYEEGRSMPRIDKLCRLAEYFRITIDELIKEDLSKEKAE